MGSPEFTAFLTIGAGAVLLLVGFAWLQNELHGPDKRWWLIFDLIVDGRPFAFVTLSMMGFGVWLLYAGWRSLP